ncbi:hypothetical protein CP488_02852 [Chthonomonas calidirosea]|nr:hypothetical protein CP488_02852 [Chthonomonas calidirosea]
MPTVIVYLAYVGRRGKDSVNKALTLFQEEIG